MRLKMTWKLLITDWWCSMNKVLTSVFCFLIFPVFLFSLEVPKLENYVNDTASIMSDTEENELNQYLSDLEKQTTVQIFVLTIPTLEGEVLERFSMEVAEAWQPGQADKDNGAILLVSLKERSLRIEVGYGLEGSLTDLMCGRIIREVIAPKFQSGDYGAGIIAGVTNMAGLATDNTEIVASEVLDEGSDDEEEANFLASILPLIIFLLIFFGRPSLLFSLLGIFLGGGRINIGGGSSSGRGGYHSSHRGGGFGGGHGGGFGGGGSSGGW